MFAHRRSERAEELYRKSNKKHLSRTKRYLHNNQIKAGTETKEMNEMRSKDEREEEEDEEEETSEIYK